MLLLRARPFQILVLITIALMSSKNHLGVKGYNDEFGISKWNPHWLSYSSRYSVPITSDFRTDISPYKRIFNPTPYAKWTPYYQPQFYSSSGANSKRIPNGIGDFSSGGSGFGRMMFPGFFPSPSRNSEGISSIYSEPEGQI